MATEHRIDLTPTWRGLLPMLLTVYVHGNTPEARNTALEELQRMADIADRAVKAEDAAHAARTGSWP